jgi:predicted dinucleotide-binding enzyme
MALYRQPKLEEADAKSRQKQQQRKGQAFAKAKEALRHAVSICLQKGETSLADTDSQFILEAVMDGSLAINVGFTSDAAEKAEVITASIVAYFKSKKF